MTEKAPEGLAHQAARLLLNRSGWYSSTLHLTLVAMALITGYCLTLSQEQRSTNFALYGGFIIGALGAYGTKRYKESQLAQQPQSATQKPTEPQP